MTSVNNECEYHLRYHPQDHRYVDSIQLANDLIILMSIIVVVLFFHDINEFPVIDTAIYFSAILVGTVCIYKYRTSFDIKRRQRYLEDIDDTLIYQCETKRHVACSLTSTLKFSVTRVDRYTTDDYTNGVIYTAKSARGIVISYSIIEGGKCTHHFGSISEVLEHACIGAGQ